MTLITLILKFKATVDVGAALMCANAIFPFSAGTGDAVANTSDFTATGDF